uniref:Uncharacterized protein n=1 Tax=Anguilla anguilla TaxID=7936 RepID=A0A0E9V4G2_ANGAN
MCVARRSWWIVCACAHARVCACFFACVCMHLFVSWNRSCVCLCMYAGVYVVVVGLCIWW